MKEQTHETTAVGQTEPMRQKLFNVRLSEEEWGRFDALATYYGMTASEVFRMLLKQEEKRLKDDGVALFHLSANHRAILAELGDEPQAHADIEAALSFEVPDTKWLPRALKDLVREGYARKVGEGYTLAPKGRAHTE